VKTVTSKLLELAKLFTKHAFQQLDAFALRVRPNQKRNRMLKVEINRWHQSPSQLRDCALKAEHLRTRERLLAL